MGGVGPDHGVHDRRGHRWFRDGKSGTDIRCGAHVHGYGCSCHCAGRHPGSKATDRRTEDLWLSPLRDPGGCVQCAASVRCSPLHPVRSVFAVQEPSGNSDRRDAGHCCARPGRQRHQHAPSVGRQGFEFKREGRVPGSLERHAGLHRRHRRRLAHPLHGMGVGRSLDRGSHRVMGASAHLDSAQGEPQYPTGRGSARRRITEGSGSHGLHQRSTERA